MKKTIFLLLLLLYSASVLAYIYKPCALCGDVFVKPKVIYAGGSLGATAFSTPGQTSISIDNTGPDPQPDFFDNKGTNYGVNADAFIGTVFIGNNSTWFPDFRLQADLIYMGGAQVKGVQTAHLGFLSKYDYQYNIAASALTASAVFDIYNYRNFEPFVAAGIGGALITTSSFKTTPIGSADPSNLTFKKSDTSKFVYHLDVGLHYQYTDRILLQAEYRYLDLGKIKTGHGIGEHGRKLDPLVSRIATSSVSFGVAYSF